MARVTITIIDTPEAKDSVCTIEVSTDLKEGDSTESHAVAMAVSVIQLLDFLRDDPEQLKAGGTD